MTYLELTREEAKAKGVKIGILKMEWKSVNTRKWAEDFYYGIEMDGKHCWEGYAENYAEAKAYAIEHIIRKSETPETHNIKVTLSAKTWSWIYPHFAESFKAHAAPMEMTVTLAVEKLVEMAKHLTRNWTPGNRWELENLKKAIAETPGSLS